jgi:hypothetical protein
MKAMFETLKPPPKDIDSPVALRLVPFITSWSTRELVDLLVEPIVHSKDSLLRVYEWHANASPRFVRVARLREILSPIKTNTPFRESLPVYPKSFFVYREELASAYNFYVDDIVGRENADGSLMLDWQPSVHPYEDLLADCPSDLLLGLLPEQSSRQQKRKIETKKRNERIYQKSIEIRAKRDEEIPSRRLTKGQVARTTWQALRDSGDVKNLPSVESITKIIREREKSAKK